MGHNEFVFLPLGGSGEIGMNMNMFGLGPSGARKWIMVDCGVTFGGLDTPGIDLITPDPAYILDDIENGGELLAVVLTHGHEDHIGAMAHLWPDFDCDVYATPFTAELVRLKFAELGLDDSPIHTVPLEHRFSIGPFDLQYLTLTHSIPEPNAVIIRTEFGTVLHTGDWKIDPRPVLGKDTDTEGLKGLADEGVLAMICDSTNVLSEGRSGSETDVAATLEQVISEQTGRVAVTTFASNVSRLVSVCRAAVKADRSVCLLGRSMLRMIDVARRVDLLPPGISFVDPAEAGFLPKDHVLYLCTGSQGEDRAAIARIARGDHPELVLEEGDTVIFSSKVIPGNEKPIFDLVNQLVENGIDVITEADAHIHVSGHPCRDELRDMYGWVKPKTSIPVHGEPRHLKEHASLALSLGVPHTVTPKNGDLIRLAPGQPRITDEVPVGRLYVDGRVLVQKGDGVMRARRKLAEQGIIVIALALDAKNRMLVPPQVLAKGIPAMDNDGDELLPLIEDLALDVMETMPKPKRGEDREIELALRRGLRTELFPRWGKRGDIEVLILRG